MRSIGRSLEDSRLYISKNLNLYLNVKRGHLCRMLIPWAYGAALTGSVADLVQSLPFSFRFTDFQYSTYADTSFNDRNNQCLSSLLAVHIKSYVNEYIETEVLESLRLPSIRSNDGLTLEASKVEGLHNHRKD